MKKIKEEINADIQALIDGGLVKAEFKNGVIEYSLTEQGKKVALDINQTDTELN